MSISIFRDGQIPNGIKAFFCTQKICDDQSRKVVLIK